MVSIFYLCIMVWGAYRAVICEENVFVYTLGEDVAVFIFVLFPNHTQISDTNAHLSCVSYFRSIDVQHTHTLMYITGGGHLNYVLRLIKYVIIKMTIHGSIIIQCNNNIIKIHLHHSNQQWN